MGKTICIISFSSYQISPYLRKYCSLLIESGIDFDYITRDEISHPVKLQKNQFSILYKESKSPIKKTINILKWRKNAIKIIKENEYKKLIILTQWSAFLLGKFLIHNYKNNYYFDIRDYVPYLSRPFFLKKMINNSTYTILSSKGFLKWIPKKIRNNKILLNHNLPFNIEKCNPFVSIDNVVIGYLGVFSYFKYNYALLNTISKNSKIKAIFAGVFYGENLIEKYAKDHNITNVEFYGKFDNDEKKNLYKKISFINSVYGNDSLIVTTALPNKLYDSLIYKRPIIATEGTYLGEVICKYGIGFTVLPDWSNLYSKITEFISIYNHNIFNENCNKFLQLCLEEEKLMRSMVLKSCIEENI